MAISTKDLLDLVRHGPFNSTYPIWQTDDYRALVCVHTIPAREYNNSVLVCSHEAVKICWQITKSSLKP